MNNPQLDEVKVLRDPIHGYIHIKDKIIWDLLGTREFQRLRRIHQLGATNQVYHTAEHSRFAHSLGVYEITRRMIEENKDLVKALSEEEKVTVMAAALLHDIGHGPFSHAIEKTTRVSHEVYTCNIILSDSEVYEVLRSYDPGLPKKVAAVISHTSDNPLLSQMISSQLDADRMDYLLRDSYFTGTSYGQYDLERILRTIRVKEGKLVFKESGMHTIEDYIMARYHMYWQVYLHPVSRSYEAIMTSLFNRLRFLNSLDPSFIDEYPMFKGIVKEDEMTNEELFYCDENSFGYGFNLMAKDASDKILQDLADRLVNRRLFAYEDVKTIGQVNEFYRWVRANGYDTDYYMCVDENVETPYKPYTGEGSVIWVLTQSGRIAELSTVSGIVAAVMGMNQLDHKVYYPKELDEV